MNSTFNLSAPPGFQGLRDDLPLHVYERFLPHWRQDGATYFVTFRLGDSLPQSKLHELRAFKEHWEKRHPPPRSKEALEELARESMQRVEDWLDQGMGSCILRDPAIAAHVVTAMQKEDGVDHELGCYVVMPNHVHAVVRPLLPAKVDVEDILRVWKGTSAHDIHLALGQSGALWQRESFDRIIRDPEHLYRVIQYIGRNPRLAGLPPGQAPLWIRPSWVCCGWDFEKYP